MCSLETQSQHVIITCLILLSSFRPRLKWHENAPISDFPFQSFLFVGNQHYWWKSIRLHQANFLPHSLTYHLEDIVTGDLMKPLPWVKLQISLFWTLLQTYGIRFLHSSTEYMTKVKTEHYNPSVLHILHLSDTKLLHKLHSDINFNLLAPSRQQCLERIIKIH